MEKNTKFAFICVIVMLFCMLIIIFMKYPEEIKYKEICKQEYRIKCGFEHNKYFYKKYCDKKVDWDDCQPFRIATDTCWELAEEHCNSKV